MPNKSQMVNTWWNSHTMEYNTLMWASNLQLHMIAESQKVIVGKDARYKILHFVWFVDKKYKADKANLPLDMRMVRTWGHNERCLKSEKCSILQARCWLHRCVEFVKTQYSLKIATALWEYSYYYFHLQRGSLRFWADDLNKVTYFLSGRAMLSGSRSMIILRSSCCSTSWQHLMSVFLFGPL